MLPRVDFYILKQAGPQATSMVACRLLEKAFQQKESVFVLCADQPAAHALDTFLWTFKDTSFIPHQIIDENATVEAPIQLGHDVEHSPHHEIVLNCSAEVPDAFKTFRRILEIVPPDPAARETLRTHYRIYQAWGCEMKTTEI